MKKIYRILDNVEASICGVLLIGVIGLLFIQVIARYGFGQSISWAEETSRFGLLGLVYISAALGTKKGTHIRVTAHLKALPKTPRALVFAFSDSIWLVFNIIVVYQSILLIYGMNKRPLVSGALMLNMQYVFALIPIGFSLQSIRLIERWYRIIFQGEPIVGGDKVISIVQPTPKG